jgi:hypothetical protein
MASHQPLSSVRTSPEDRKAVVLTIAVLVGLALVGMLFLAEQASEARARRELLRAVSHASAVAVNGQLLVDPLLTLSALRGTTHIASHHSSPTSPIHLELREGDASTAVTIARDSDRPNEFWIYLPGANWHNNALGRDAGRVVSEPLSQVLRDRGL